MIQLQLAQIGQHADLTREAGVKGEVRTFAFCHAEEDVVGHVKRLEIFKVRHLS